MSEARHQIICKFKSFKSASEFRDIHWPKMADVMEEMAKIATITRNRTEFYPPPPLKARAKEKARIDKLIAKIRKSIEARTPIIARLLNPKTAVKNIENISKLAGLDMTNAVATNLGGYNVIWDTIGTYDGEAIGRGLRTLLNALRADDIDPLPERASISLVDSDCMSPHEYPKKPRLIMYFDKE